MRYLVSLEEKILKVIEKEDDGEGLSTEFPSFLSQFGIEHSGETAEAKEQWERFDYHVNQMESRGFLKVTHLADDCYCLELLPMGHERLEFHRNNIWYRRAGRKLGDWFDKATTSILMPIIAAVLTVLVMQYFGIAR